MLAGGLTLVPTVQALVAGSLPRILPGVTEELPRALVGLVNLPKSLAYWWRLGSLYIGRRLEQTVYADAGAAASEAETAFAAGLTSVVIAVSTVSVAVAVFASWRYFRRHPSFDLDDLDRRGSPAAWLRAYAGWCLAALCAAATLSPVPVQGWHVVIALHAACLPVAAWMHAAFTTRTFLPRAAAASFILLEVVVVLLLAFGHPMYRPVSGDALARQDLPDAVRPPHPRPAPVTPPAGSSEAFPSSRARACSELPQAALHGLLDGAGDELLEQFAAAGEQVVLGDPSDSVALVAGSGRRLREPAQPVLRPDAVAAAGTAGSPQPRRRSSGPFPYRLYTFRGRLAYCLYRKVIIINS